MTWGDMGTSGNAGKTNQTERSGGEGRRKDASAKESDSIRVARIGTRGTIIAALIGLVGVIIGVTLNTGNDTPSGSRPSSPGPSPEGLTIDQVRGALLTPSDLTSIDSNLASSDVVFPIESSCKGWAIKPMFNLDRELNDSNNLIVGDVVAIFNSSRDAHTAFAENARQMTCSYTKIKSVSNISSGLHEICDESSARAVMSVDNNGVTVSSYLGEIRCGRAIVGFALGA